MSWTRSELEALRDLERGELSPRGVALLPRLKGRIHASRGSNNESIAEAARDALFLAGVDVESLPSKENVQQVQDRFGRPRSGATVHWKGSKLVLPRITREEAARIVRRHQNMAGRDPHSFGTTRGGR